MARRSFLRSVLAVAGCAWASALGAGCPPRELRVQIASLDTAVAECATASGTLENCGPDTDAGRFVEQVGDEYRVRTGACVAARLAIVARPEEPEDPWPAERRARSTCVALAADTRLERALADAVDESLAEGLAVEDVESPEEGVFLLGLFGSESTECDCGSGSELFACSRLSAPTNDGSVFGIACTQCSGRSVTDNDFATCSKFAGERCFFEGCLATFEDR